MFSLWLKRAEREHGTSATAGVTYHTGDEEQIDTGSGGCPAKRNGLKVTADVIAPQSTVKFTGKRPLM